MYRRAGMHRRAGMSAKPPPCGGGFFVGGAMSASGRSRLADTVCRRIGVRSQWSVPGHRRGVAETSLCVGSRVA